MENAGPTEGNSKDAVDHTLQQALIPVDPRPFEDPRPSEDRRPPTSNTGFATYLQTNRIAVANSDGTVTPPIWNDPYSPIKVSPRTERRTYVEFLQEYIDKTITYNYWNKYIASAFWSNISTPVNLTITLLSALTAAQANSAGFLDPTTYANISVAMLLLTTVNTFFRPHDQAAANIEWLEKWNAVGIMFEDAYYDHMELGTTIALGETVRRYKAIQEELDTLRRADGPGNINFITDFIHYVSMQTCLNGDTWIEYKA